MSGDVTQLLSAIESGDPKAAQELLPLVYDELRRLAAYRLAGENRQYSLQPTALVHEAWLKISGPEQREWNGRHHFFAAAAEAMRRILVDRARRRLAVKRGGGADPVPAEELELPAPAPDKVVTFDDVGTGDRAVSLKFDADDRYLIAVGNRQVRLYQVSARSERLVLSNREAGVNDIGFSPDSQRFGSVGGERRITKALGVLRV